MRPLLLCLAGLALAAPPAARAQSCGTTTGKVPLIDLGAGLYQGFEGGLYPGGQNAPPPAHLQAALQRAGNVQPLAVNGLGDPVNGRIVLLSIGMSNTFQEFARFERQEDVNVARNPQVVILNGAQGGKSAEQIRNPAAIYWSVVSSRLDALGLDENQVQVVWLEELNVDPPDDFPLHAQKLRDDLEAIVQILHDRFPNLQLCYLSDRSYGGYTTTINPEPQAYETGFAVKWLIRDQIDGAPGLNHDPAQGPVEAPLLLWGPYLWADGESANGLGTRWCACDFEGCANVHPGPSGEQKVADLLSAFFASDATTQAWYPNPGLTTHSWRGAEADAHVDASQPAANFGADPWLFSQGSPAAHAYVRFDVSGVQRPVSHAKLSLRVAQVSLSSTERQVHLVADSNWDEATITFDDAPPLGAVVGTLPRTTRDGTLALDVTSEVNADADGVLTFAIAATSGQGPAFLVRARESGAEPRLVLIPYAGSGGSGTLTCQQSNGVGHGTGNVFLRSSDLSQPGAGLPAENVTLPGGFAVTSMSWEGAYLDAQNATECAPQNDFTITIYDDNGTGTAPDPLSVVATYSVGSSVSSTPTGEVIPTGGVQRAVFEHSAILPTPFTVPAAGDYWFQVANDTPAGPAGCHWAWRTAPGDGKSSSNVGGLWVPRDHDLDLCLNDAPGVTAYCTAGVSASGCAALMSASGTASSSAPSGFVLHASSVEGLKDGLFFYAANGRQASPWGNGTSFQCVVPPVFRGGLLWGTGTAGQCDGSFTQDLNARWCPTCPKPGHNPKPGAVVQAQAWYRDPLSTSNRTTSLSNAVEFHVSP